ncbi:hypothetical protein Ahy_B02g057311 isoform B [Arachis hypogaea]|uniref:NB-ARC domain-containing protein n=1 Tax=Arachis hypogaea TaxID=3818 RepID=A0A445ABI0_ARAHY|nr:hypothetical protein Ahy_B02g057311 isoform B [Arachis hypogaea]
MADNMEGVVARIEFLVNQKDNLGLQKSTKDNNLSSSSSSWRETTCLMEGNIYGRENDQQALIKIINDKSESQLSVIPIVGMGGVGKTTLAKWAYSVVEGFDLKAWCFEELASRLFFKPYKFSSKIFLMHDLLHDLAIFLAGDFYGRIEELGEQEEKKLLTRHLSHISRGSLDSIGKLIHLRYLNLSGTDVKALPESLCNLFNLQTLILSGCSMLTMLPNDMHKLVNLRHLDLRRTSLKEMPRGISKLTHMRNLDYFVVGKHKDNGIQELGGLSKLEGSFKIKKLENVVDAGQARSAKMEDKNHIDKLSLKWRSDDKMVSNKETLRDILDGLQPHTGLKELKIKRYKGERFPDWVGRCSYNNMTSVSLVSCKDCCMLPSLGQLPSLKSLRIEGFLQLKRIGDEFYKNDCDHHSSPTAPFPSLETLEFNNMPCWEEWHVPDPEAFPRLRTLEIEDCGMLKGDMLNGVLWRRVCCLREDDEGRSDEMVGGGDALSIRPSPSFNARSNWLPKSLQKLKILMFPKFEFLEHKYDLVELQIEYSCDSLTSLSLDVFPNLKNLEIRGCRNLESVSMSEAPHAALQRLSITSCHKLVSFAGEGLAAPNLTHLHVSFCSKLEALPCDMKSLLPSLQSLKICDCSDMCRLAEGGLPPNLKELEVGIGEQQLRDLSWMPNFYALTRLTIIGFNCDSVTSYPEVGSLPHLPSLTTLYIEFFDNLETLKCNELLRLTSLQQLHILLCPKLENMVGEKLPPSLLLLDIEGCGLLGEHCKNKHQLIWPKISHIPNVRVKQRFLSRKMVDNMEGVVARIEFLVSQKDILGLQKNTKDNNLSSSSSSSSSWRETTCLMEGNIYGREDDQQALIKIINDNSESQLSVIPIVGMGGVGKTTLAKWAYSVAEGFDLKAWICISETFDVAEITRKTVEEITKTLLISYFQLPPYLKRCFVYCSLFPKDYYFDKLKLILLWMAEDLLRPPKRGESLEEVGSQCFEELASRLFFKPAAKDFPENYVMHDLLHDLAVFLAGDFYCRIEEFGEQEEKKVLIRHLSHLTYGSLVHPISKAFKFIVKSESLRTSLYIDDLLSLKSRASKLKYLRVLSFSKLDVLPDSIGKLIHLRYLNLFRTNVKTLPESLCNLYNLQTLILYECSKLAMLPDGMHKLVKLRHLLLGGTCLKEMPRGISKLKHMHILDYFVVGKHKDNGIQELGGLSNLEGLFEIRKLENVADVRQARSARMLEKDRIDKLLLEWSWDHEMVSNTETERDILDGLQPHNGLKELKIMGYKGERFPDWVGHSSYNNMTTVWLSCKNCCMLPSLGQLPSLKSLSIEGFLELKRIGDEFYKSDSHHDSSPTAPFPSLETLEFHKMPCWEEWHVPDPEAFPQLKILRIERCPMFKGDMLNGIFRRRVSCLSDVSKVEMREDDEAGGDDLSIRGSQSFNARTINHLCCLQELRISGCPSIVSFPGNCIPKSLQKLKLCKCSKLEFPEQQQHKYDLVELQIEESCDSLTSLSLDVFPNLKNLEIFSCRNLESVSISDPPHAALQRLIFRRCSNLVSFAGGLAAPNLTQLTIFDCPELVSFAGEGVAAPNLTHLHVADCRKLEALPRDMKSLLPSLHSLLISGSDMCWMAEGGLPPNLKSLFVGTSEQQMRDLSWMGNLHALTHLTIYGSYCDNIKSYPEVGSLPHLPSLTTLYIEYFDNLETLECNELLHLTSLQQLHINSCPRLENMEGEKLPPSLLLLKMEYCGLLGEHCKNKHQLIWPKISHIPTIQVDDKQIF